MQCFSPRRSPQEQPNTSRMAIKKASFATLEPEAIVKVLGSQNGWETWHKIFQLLVSLHYHAPTSKFSCLASVPSCIGNG